MRSLCLALCLALCLGCGGKPAARPMTLKALGGLVAGQTADTVMARLGPPDSVENTFRGDGSVNDTVRWFYDGMLQEGADKPKRSVTLWITAGRVAQIDPH